MKAAIEAKSKDLEGVANRLKWRVRATPLNDNTLRIHAPLTEIEKMCKRIEEMVKTIDDLEIKQKTSNY
jgi:hypothetical protein